MSEVLSVGEVSIPDWTEGMKPREYVPFRELMNSRGPRVAFMMHDIKYVRSMIRNRRNGESEPMQTYSIDVTWPNGETAVWEFDSTLGWPKEDGETRDWRSEWIRNFEGVA